MIQISSSSILKEISKNEFMIGTFRDLMKSEVIQCFTETGHVRNQFGALYKGLPEQRKHNLNYETKTFYNFQINKEGFETIQKFNWSAHRPMVACSVAFEIRMPPNILGITDTLVLLTIEEQFVTMFHVFKVVDDENAPGKQILVDSPQDAQRIQEIGLPVAYFKKVIDNGVNIWETLS